MIGEGLQAHAIASINTRTYSTGFDHTAHKVFCGGLPYDLTEREIRELVGAYGPLKAFHLVKDKDSILSKGYCFYEYADPEVTDVAIAVSLSWL